jgi:microcompartment protein CcmK/EutM
MYLGRVTGCVWSTAKDARMDGKRLLIVQPVTPELKNTGKPLVCGDCTGAGTGELVYWVRGKEASFPFPDDPPPFDTTVVGIVDSVHLAARALPPAAPARSGSSPAPPASGGRKNSRKS